ncbi:MAG: acyl-CoA/acyl-ACP dehydrogenase [Novosphingobium sp.]|nr:acyl-CoA/acyl-ACP dehydrogenase [Novosphingobium sp.]
MDFSDDEDIVAMRGQIRRFVEREVPPELAAQWDREDHIPRDWLQRVAGLGVCGLTVPEEYGGLGMSVMGVLATIMELGRGGIMLASLYIQNACYGGINISEFGSEAQKRDLLPRLCNGELMFAYGLSEPDVGADLASVKTKAERRGDQIVINGTKRWCTGAAVADYIYMLVRTGDPDARYQNLSFLLVPPDSKGVTLEETETLGLRGLPTNDVILEDVELPLACVVGGEDRWNRGWQMLAGPSLEVEKLVSSSLGLVTAQSAVKEAWEYSQQRKQFGKPICAQQSIRHVLAEAQTKLQACRLMLINAAQLVEAGQPSAVDTSMAKLFVSDTAREIVLSCQEVLGAYGYAQGFAMERYVRDVLVMPIWGGSSAIQKNNISNLMRLPKA